MSTLTNLDMLITSMAEHLKQKYLSSDDRQHALMVGIHSGGVWVAEKLYQLTDLTLPLGKLDIAFYRDDFTQIGLQPTVRPSSLPVDVNNRHVILVDDVLYTGRTVRAALNEIFDYGRPARVTLAVLVRRNGRELPIQPNIIGCTLYLDTHQQVKLTGPDPLTLEIRNR